MPVMSLQSRKGAAHINKYLFALYNINRSQELFLSSVSFAIAFHVKCGYERGDFKILSNRLWHEFLSYVKFTLLKTYFYYNVKKLQNMYILE